LAHPRFGQELFNDFLCPKDQANDGARSKEFAALRSFAARELGDEVFVNLPKQVTGEIGWDIGEIFE
jgi:hypothetical protein